MSRQELKVRFEKLLQDVGANPEPPLPLATLVAVVEQFDVPVNGCHTAIATLDAGGVVRHVAVSRNEFHEGQLAVLFATNACVKHSPMIEKWRGQMSKSLDFDFGQKQGKIKFVMLKADRRRYRYNGGILIPASEFSALDGCAVGEDVSERVGAKTHNDCQREALDAAAAEKEARSELEKDDHNKEVYLRACVWRLHRTEKIVGTAPSFVRRTVLENLEDHPEYFQQYEHLLFDVSEKYRGVNVSVYYTPTADGRVHLCHNGLEIEEDENNYFWGVIKHHGVDRGLIDIGCPLSLEGVVTGPSIRGGALEGRSMDNFSVFDIVDIESGSSLAPSERFSFVKSCGISHVKMVARRFPLFERAPTIGPLLKTATRPSAAGGIRYGHVFRSILHGQPIAFQLTNPDYRPKRQQLKIDAYVEKIAQSMSAG